MNSGIKKGDKHPMEGVSTEPIEPTILEMNASECKVEGTSLASSASGVCLCDSVEAALQTYFSNLQGQPPTSLYKLVTQEVERPLLKTVMAYCDGNQSKAATILGINRNTLRSKLQRYDPL